MSTKAGWRGGVLRYFDSATQERVFELCPVRFYDDFLNPSLVVPAAGSLESGVNWAKKITGAAPPTVAGVANGVNGLMKCALTSAAQKQDAGLYLGDQLVFSALQGLVFEARVNVGTLPTLADAQAVIGLTGAWADGPDAITYSAFFTLRGPTAGLVYCDTDDNVTDKDVTSGITVVAGDYHIYRIDFTDPLNILFFIDGVQVAASTTFGWAASAANSKLQPYLGMYKVGGDAGVGDITVDYVRIGQNRS